MDIRDRQGIYAAADSTLARASGLKKLVLLHAGISAAVMLAVTVLDFVLQNQIDATGGLSGMGMRSVLSTASTVLQLAVNLALPFWTISYAAIVLRTLRGETCGGRDLLTGFFHFGPVLRLMLLKEIIVMLLAVVLCYPAMMLFMATPWARPLLSAMLSSSTDTEALYAAMETVMGPMLAVFMGVVLLAAVPIFYRLRFAELSLMDEPQKGALAAMGKSLRLTKGSCLSLLKIDLHFWWYYLLELVITLLAYTDTLAMLLGIALPVDGTVLFFGTYAVHLLAQVGLYCWKKNQIELTYGVCYRTLEKTAPQPRQEKPRNLPWNYEG